MGSNSSSNGGQGPMPMVFLSTAQASSSKMNFSQVINATGKNSVKKTIPGENIWFGGSRGRAAAPNMSFGR